MKLIRNRFGALLVVACAMALNTVAWGDGAVALLNFGPCEENVASPQPQEPMIFPMPETAKPVAVKK